MQKIKWQKIVGRKADVQKVIQFASGTGYYFKKIFCLIPSKNSFYYFNGRTVEIYVDGDDYADFNAQFQEKILSSETFLKNYPQRMTNVCNECLVSAKKINKGITKKLIGKDLLISLQKYNDIWRTFYPYGWFFFYATQLEEMISLQIEPIIKSSENLDEIIKIIAQPYLIPPVAESETAILKLALKIKQNTSEKQINTLVKSLESKFGWMSVYNTDDQIRSADYYIVEAREIIKSGINIKEKIKILKQRRLNNEKRYKIFLKRIKNRTLKEQIKFFHIASYLRDKREEVRDRLTILERKLYEEIACQTGLLLKDVIYLTDKEIKIAILDKRKTNLLKGVSEERQGKFIVLVKLDKYKIYQKSLDLKRLIKQLPSEKSANSFSGQVAFRVSTQIYGNVKVVLSNRELNKVREGDVLVTTMTKPDYVGAMKKAIAFVTDEGGLLSHAAIIARELKKPCIIGTKIATKVLKDGDFVEVDANKGIVKIIKRAK